MPTPRTDLAIESVDDDLLVLDKTACKLHNLNHTASIVWRGITDGLSSGKIACRLIETFDVTFDRARRDIELIVNQFESLNLLESENKKGCSFGLKRSNRT